jgi:methylthioribose-1-phosphate isomerase
MNVNGQAYRTIRLHADGWSVEIIDQRRLPHEFVLIRLTTLEEAAEAIGTMAVRGAPLIGAAAAYGLCLGLRPDASDKAMRTGSDLLLKTRPTAVNLRWALDEMGKALLPLPPEKRLEAAYRRAAEICDNDVETNRRIGGHGLKLIEPMAKKKKGERVNILTHCNAGWLAGVDWGMALAPVYLAHDAGIPVHVWVDETRPRNQGAALTAWELKNHGVPHTLIADNAGGHLMQHGQVDLCLVGADRVTACGDVCNKIGTYLKALAAHDNGVPFYAAFPASTIDWRIADGVAEIPIEQRDAREVTHLRGLGPDGHSIEIALAPADTHAVNYGFDVTPARLMTGLITERGLVQASAEGLRKLFPG